MYKQADIYLLDDPLSAVDTRVGKYLFKKCINGNSTKSAFIITRTKFVFLLYRFSQRKNVYPYYSSSTILDQCRSNSPYEKRKI